MLPPVRVTFPLMKRSVKLPTELIRMLPVLVMVPVKVVVEALSAMKTPLFVTLLSVADPGCG